MERTSTKQRAFPGWTGGLVIAGLVALVAFAGTARADDPQPPPGPPPGPPPAEAFAACQGRSNGDACVVNIHEHQIPGTCITYPGDGRLVCRPNGPPPGPPPAEAFAACENHASGDACTVHVHDMDIHGTCVTFPGQNRLFCRP